MKKLFAVALLTLTIISCQDKTKQQENIEDVKIEKIISLNGSITEVLVSLGESDNIIGVDVTSTYPKDIKERTKDLGHVTSISIESLISLQPTIVFASSKDINDDLKNKITEAGIKLEVITQEFSPEGTKKMIEQVATALGKKDYQHILVKIDKDLENLKPINPKPKVLFIYARGAGILMVAGTDTPMEKIIALAGGENVVTEFSNYKPLTPESLIKDNPDVILLFTTGLESLNGIDGILKMDGIAATNAGKNKKIISMDGQLLAGFGPRLGEAVTELNELLSN